MGRERAAGQLAETGPGVYSTMVVVGTERVIGTSI